MLIQDLTDDYTLIHSTGFQYGSGYTDWGSVRGNDDAGPPMLSRHDGEQVEKTFDLDGSVGEAVIEFRFVEFGSWDGEEFIMHVNGAEFVVGAFNSEQDGYVYGQSSIEVADGVTLEFGRQSGRGDMLFRDVRVTVENPGDQLTIGFSSTLDEPLGDDYWRFVGESWGVDDLKIHTKPSEDKPDGPAPAAFTLYDDGASPVESASYDAETGDLTVTFSWDKLLQADGQWGNARHIDFVRFEGEMYGVNIHSDDAPQNPDGSYIYDRTTMENTFTFNIGAGHDPADGVLAFELHDYEDGSVKLYDFNLTDGDGIDQTGLVTAVNAGGGDFTTIEGLTYAADTSGGGTYSEDHAIENTTADGLYQTEKGQWNGFTYKTAVENGVYDVELKLAEIWSGAQQAGARTFSLNVQDQVVFENLDLTAEYGFATAVDFVGSVEVTNGVLTIEGINGSNNAKIAGFSIWESDAAAPVDFTEGSIIDYRSGAAEAIAGPNLTISPYPGEDGTDLGELPEWFNEPAPTSDKKPEEDGTLGPVWFIEPTTEPTGVEKPVEEDLGPPRFIHYLYDDGASPVESASYDAYAGDLTMTFAWDKLLQADGQWGSARHIDYVRFDGEMYGVNIHSEGDIKDASGAYIYDRTTMENTFTFNIGTGHDAADGVLAFELHDYEDGSVKLYDFNLTDGDGIDQTGLVTAVNAGGGDFTTIEGLTYAADTSGGGTYSEDHAIENTTADGLYQTEKGQWNGFTYETAVENGVYDVELKLAEIWSGAQEAGARTFSLKVEDQFVFQDLDMTAEHGFATAVDYIGSVEVTDGSLTIEGINGSNNAKIAGFSIWESDAAVPVDFAEGSITEYREAVDAFVFG